MTPVNVKTTKGLSTKKQTTELKKNDLKEKKEKSTSYKVPSKEGEIH